jgi:glycosyltransferase involved in cell wall biosynthesis
MITAWSLLALRADPPEAIVVGTDPILSVTIALAWKFFRPRTRILHWCFDLYPEAAYADHLLSSSGMVARFLHALLRHAYAKCDWIVAIGPCMLERLTLYRSGDQDNGKEQWIGEDKGPFAIIVPWALQEPAEVLRSDTAERNAIFGDVHLTLLYSGNFGRAHTYDAFLLLAQQLRSESAALAFSVRGNREPELYNAVQAIDAKNACPIRFVPFAAPDRLLERLAAPDVHMLSLAPAWTGTVVPSKFFGALAAGRPVCYSGAPDSSVARWISRYELGWLLTPETVPAVAADLIAYVSDPERVRKMQQRCRDTYQELFSKRASIDHMHRLLARASTST